MTVERLKSEMSFPELMLWEEYVKENGPLALPLRIESAIARAVSPFLKNAKPRDLMIWPKEQEPEATPETMLLMFKNLASKTKRKN